MMNFDPHSWFDEDNYALTDGAGSIALFDQNEDGVYSGHYFFKVRGREALRLGKEMLSFLFEHTEIKVLRGLTPLTNLAARWMSRQLGFTSQGVIHTKAGPCELFLLIKERE